MNESAADVPAEIDTSKPHPARMYDYFLGGKNHFAADRETAQKMLSAAPHARTGARENRAFLGRVVRYLAAEAGIRQFLDIGTGLPTTNNVHEVAQAVTSCTLFVVGSPVPMSRNCQMPASAARYRTTRPRKARFSRAAVGTYGECLSTSLAVFLSAAKWFFPPMK